MKRSFDEFDGGSDFGPRETKGVRAARKARKACKKLQPKTKELLVRRAMRLIRGKEKPLPLP